jgi:hypothetical protein
VARRKELADAGFDAGAATIYYHLAKRAEEVGFEPTVALRPQRFSRPSDSSTLALLQLDFRVAAPV